MKDKRKSSHLQKHQIDPLRYFESMDKINQAMQGNYDLDEVMKNVLDALLSVFECDRAWLVYPCDPEAVTWQTPMERTRPEFPGVLPIGVELPLDPVGAAIYRILRNTDGPVQFGPKVQHPVPTEMADIFQVQSFIAMAFYPKVGKPWSFGLHQCSYARFWTADEELIFKEAGRRLSDTLTSLLMYRDLRASEEKYRALADNIPNVVFQCKNNSRYTFIYLNNAIEELTGYSKSDFLEKDLSFFDLYHPDDLKAMPTPKEDNTVEINRKPFHITYRIHHKSGEWRWVDEWGTGITNSNGKVEYLEGIMVDITERKQHEREREGIIAVSAALRQANTRKEILNIIIDQLINLFQADGVLLALPTLESSEIGKGSVIERMRGLSISPWKKVCNWVIENKKTYINNHKGLNSIFDDQEQLEDSDCIATVPLIAQEKAIGALWLVRHTDISEADLNLLSAIADITANALHRVILHDQTKQQLNHLTALHQIDMAITNSLDSSVTINVILNHVKNELKVDAVDILLLSPVTRSLNYVAGLGFKTRNIEKSQVKLSEDFAGNAAQERRTISCPDLRQFQETFIRSKLLADEEFIVHFATPLIAKGQVKGVLEIFHRKPLTVDSDWINYFEALATQAAIAIESASLLENLQRSNTELMLAYDVTIEGWSRALDLRDQETEGHTQRVTEMALRLAEKMGMSDIDKLNLRRGALLHDIGKMGIPDSILLKPDVLQINEKEIMKQHPSYAYKMLFPISYLKHALDIPYCHHEKWDGSGYPRGLRGEEIPLAARLFSIVDVFDALTSDRPYRQAWSHKEAYQYIKKEAGKHFDPKIVEIFLENSF
ncbi:MAG: GAF domain-containing protein [Anaerolineales bacterium]